MPSDLSNFLASRYLVADPKPHSKRRKRKQAEPDGLVITDDNDLSWTQSDNNADKHGDELPLTVHGCNSELRKATKNNWKPLGSPASPTEVATADAILASTAAEKRAKGTVDDENPVIEGGDGLVRMSDGTHAGLQTAAAVSAQLKQRQREERDEFEQHKRSAKEEETVYRDATGRRIDISMKRAEARRAELLAENKAKLAKQALKGAVQLDDLQRQREKLEDAKFLRFSRTADDEEMNKELKGQKRWNDPMLQFIGDKNDKAKSQIATTSGRPMYAGAVPPNRYGVKPGYRWDGVDRGIGFEAERFKAINRRDRIKGLNYSWQMDE
ncbi:cell cycle control protein (Cwf26) [Pochonia chlamydosporia 170]|uniref:Cell cycle control protein (Cwf26) n=1 Tax=Pochonia chlamydosporia 170 TaxID=1380566 RepID=A0A179F9V1_METCM|nr:cell cycle control protein (Cwf26) [Pochonia chlamydosporia 170]OAQ62244.1 cell cycle control protein (Cwf26) [Pochonia chlamydosporia 170]